MQDVELSVLAATCVIRVGRVLRAEVETKSRMVEVPKLLSEGVQAREGYRGLGTAVD